VDVVDGVDVVGGAVGGGVVVVVGEQKPHVVSQ